MPVHRYTISVSAICVLLLGFATAGGAVAGRDALWQVVSNICVRGQENAGVSFPCRVVNLKAGFALLKVARWHFLLIPTARIEGIESPELVAPDAPNFWEDAWEARLSLDEAMGNPLAREQIGLVVNSAQARTQDQFHIHIGCVRPQVTAALQTYEASIRQTWSTRTFRVGRQKYRIMRIVGETLQATNPTAVLANGIPAARDSMARQTLAVLGARFRDGSSGFYVLSDYSRGSQAASGESLLDYQCSVRRVGDE